MARYRGPKCKICREKGEKLFLKGGRCATGKCSFNRRPYPPGAQGETREGRKHSDYGKQLYEKQKAKHIYGVLERQFKNYFKKAKRLRGPCGENLLVLLERRLDNVVYRGGWAPTRAAARQMVRHNHIKVKGKRMNIPSYLVKISDVIERDPAGEISGSSSCDWLKTDSEKIEVIRFPERKEIALPVDENMIVALYSK